MSRLIPVVLSLVAPLVLCRCETMEDGGDDSGGTVTVQDTLFYPDESDTTFVVLEGARIVGAGGTNCHYLVQKGGSLTTHAGQNNTYKIESGGHFRGFAHPATSCTVTYEPGAIMEVEERGPETRFVALGAENRFQ